MMIETLFTTQTIAAIKPNIAAITPITKKILINSHTISLSDITVNLSGPSE